MIVVKLIVAIFVLLFSTSVYAGDLDYWIKNGKFVTSEGEIPDGCLGQLLIELNGDDTVAAIFINRTVLRGCIAANLPYPGGDETKISYTIEKELGNHEYELTVCESVSGSMGSSCSNILVKFANRNYATKGGEVKQVLSLEKMGEWQKDE
jgi:hypothetical protein